MLKNWIQSFLQVARIVGLFLKKKNYPESHKLIKYLLALENYILPYILTNFDKIVIAILLSKHFNCGDLKHELDTYITSIINEW